MKKGKLTFNGTIDINQFWPQNILKKNPFDSDADTVKIKVDMNSVLFTSPLDKVKKSNFLKTSGFISKVTNKTTNVVSTKFKGVINKDNIITIRVQGIDAPELHYMTGKPLYRQQMGETSTIALFNFLKKFTKGKSSLINCEVFTQVNKPNDVFDKYGRCVADIVVNGININNWLVENGYAFPAFYNSMTFEEINTISKLAKKASTKKLNIWKFYSNKVEKLDRKLIHDKKVSTYNARADKKSPILFPKLFRRLWTFEIGQKNKKTDVKLNVIFTTVGFKKYLTAQKDDICFQTSAFLKKGSNSKSFHLADFVASNGDIRFKPAEIVFKEGGTSLKDKNGKPITAF